jgi:[acyl-carrier-protein] S-malonyltransferase
MTGQWAALFPGQGSQYVGMGRALAEASVRAREVFQEADDVLGYALSEIMWNGPEARLRDTEVQQPAILTVSVATWRALAWPSLPAAACGLSLGEYSALVASGLMTFRDAVRVVEVRGRAMQEAVPRGQGGMTAVLGLDTAVVEEVCLAVREAGFVEPANYNAPGQVVVSGDVAGLVALENKVKERGGRTVRLSVSAPFHSLLLKPAERPLEQALVGVDWRAAQFPVLANVDARAVTSGSEAIPRLIAQVSRPVRFEQSVRALMADGIDCFVEIGPGRSLASLIRKIDRGLKVASVEAPDSFAAALELL